MEGPDDRRGYESLEQLLNAPPSFGEEGKERHHEVTVKRSQLVQATKKNKIKETLSARPARPKGTALVNGAEKTVEKAASPKATASSSKQDVVSDIDPRLASSLGDLLAEKLTDDWDLAFLETHHDTGLSFEGLLGSNVPTRPRDVELQALKEAPAERMPGIFVLQDRELEHLPGMEAAARKRGHLQRLQQQYVEKDNSHQRMLMSRGFYDQPDGTQAQVSSEQKRMAKTKMARKVGFENTATLSQSAAKHGKKSKALVGDDDPSATSVGPNVTRDLKQMAKANTGLRKSMLKNMISNGAFDDIEDDLEDDDDRKPTKKSTPAQDPTPKVSDLKGSSTKKVASWRELQGTKQVVKTVEEEEDDETMREMEEYENWRRRVMKCSGALHQYVHQFQTELI